MDVRLDGATRHFDVRAEAGRLDAAQSGTWAMTYVGVAALLGFGAVLVYLGSSRAEWVFAGIGGAMLVFGTVMGFKVLRDRRLRLESLDVTASGVRFTFSDRSTRVIRWSDPRVQMVLNDWRLSRIYGMSGLKNVPCTVSAVPTYGALSVDALKAIRTSALEARIPVIDQAPDASGRRTLIGDWPKESRPFTPPGPYE